MTQPNHILFRVLGYPVAQPRHRIGAPRFGGGKARAFIPATHRIHGFRQVVTLCARQAMEGRKPLEGPLLVKLTFVLPRPVRLGRGGREPADRRPDLENCAKGVWDAMTVAGVWGDDAQIVCCGLEKYYAATGEDPFTDVYVEMLVEEIDRG